MYYSSLLFTHFHCSHCRFSTRIITFDNVNSITLTNVAHASVEIVIANVTPVFQKRFQANLFGLYSNVFDLIAIFIAKKNSHRF